MVKSADESKSSNYSEYLLPSEKVEKVFHLGFSIFKFHTVLATNRRLLIIKRFPRNVADIDYPSIEIVEYYTNIEWIQMLFSGLLWLLAALFFVNRGVVIKGLGDFLPPLAPVLTYGSFLGLNPGTFLIVGAFVAGAIYHMGFWILSFFGKLRLIMFDQAPIDVVTSFDKDTQDLIKLTELRKPASSQSSFRRTAISTDQIGAIPKKKKQKKR